jgi:class 3 adenylate cyclase
MSQTTGTVRVLLVDDQDVVGKFVARMIANEEDVSFRFCADAREALAVAREHQPTIILQDLHMPDIDGWALMEEYSRDETLRDVPVIILTGREEAETKAEAFARGACDYLVKTPGAVELLARLRYHSAACINRRRQRDLEKELEQRIEERTQQLQQQAELFRKFVPHIFTEGIDEGGLDITKGLAREKEYTVFSADIRDFTDFSESITPAECYSFLNSFFGLVEPVIRENGGFVYQYVGDEIMALFEPTEGTDNAVRAAMSLQNNVIKAYNFGRERADYYPIRIGIGLNTGSVAIGIAGTPERMDACAFGNTVNVAARCEELTKTLAAPTIMTESTYRRLSKPDSFTVRDLGEIEVRGIKESVRVYEALEYGVSPG